MSETKIQENEDLDDVNEEVESYNEVDKRDIVTLKKEMEKKPRPPPSEKQILARKANAERLLLIQKQKKR
jgi:hypothetical protein